LLSCVPEYRDYSDKDAAWIERQLQARELSKKSASGAKAQFPSMLYAMLEAGEATGIIGWVPHGRAFKIHDRQLFEDILMPAFFSKQSEISSFQRQLCLYGFRRFAGNHSDQHAYYHELFLRGRPDLCQLIHRARRLRQSEASKRRVYDPDSEPDLYNYRPMPKDSYATSQSSPFGSLSQRRVRPNISSNPAKVKTLPALTHLAHPEAPRDSLWNLPWQGREESALEDNFSILRLDSSAMNEKIPETDFREKRHMESFTPLPCSMRKNSSACLLQETKWTDMRESHLEAMNMDCSESYDTTSSAVVGLAEYLDGFHMIIEMDDHSILSDSDMSVL
jgi:HSF-type DNA-binding